MAEPQFETPDIAAALGSSHSVREAREKLGMSETALESRCRDEGLIALYEACAERGKATRGKRRNLPALPRWSVVWLKPTTGSGTVRIWPPRIEAATEEEALKVARIWTGRQEIAVVKEEIT